MSAPETDPGGRDQLLQEAAGWFARMRGPEANAHKEEFEAWLRRGALHRQAYNRASEIFAMGKYLRETQPPQPDRARTSPARRRLLVSLATLPLLAAAGWLMLGGVPSQRPQPDQVAERSAAPAAAGRRVATGPGETRSARLADGSLVELRGASQMEVRFDDRVRRLVLERGTARFAVAHDARPLVVEAGGGRIRALGTLFEVAIAADGEVSVYLIEGSVEVTPPATGPAGPAMRQLSAGEGLTYSALPAGGAARPSGRPAPDQPAAGASPARDYDNVTVAELVASANRGEGRRIRLGDPAIGALRVSGRFSIGDPPVLAERLVTLFGLVRTDGPGGDILLSRRP